MASATTYYELSPEEISELTDYIIHRETLLDHDLLPYADPAGKDILVFGCGFGNEVLWAARHGARSVLATDLTPALSPVPLQRALERQGIEYEDYEFRRQNVHDTALTGESFDLIISNGVFEHIFDLKGVLGAFRPLLRPGGRVAIFADTLWYSSRGGHIQKGPWEHLFRSPADLKPELTTRQWDVLCNHLNRMTAVDFIEAVRSSGMLILKLGLAADPEIGRLPELLPKIRERDDAPMADLSVISIGCELCFPENL
jgi:SAM-dependent methyltransferase